MDPVSLTASALAFAGAATKIKETISQVSDNRERLSELKESVLLGLHDLQCLLSVDNSNICPASQARLRADLDRLRRELERVHARCTHYSKPPSGRFVAGVISRAKSWTHSKSIRGDIARIDRLLQAAYTRFLMVTSTDARRAALQAAENSLAMRDEQREQMVRLESAYIKMLAKCNSENKPIWTSSTVTQTDLDFLLRQVRKIVAAFGRETLQDAVQSEPPSGHHEKEYPYPATLWGCSFESIFHCGLTEACHSIGILVTHSDSQPMPIQRSAKALLFLSNYLRALAAYGEVESVIECASKLYSRLHAEFPCRQYQRCLAFALARVAWHNADLSLNQQALELYEDLYTSSSDAPDLDGMIFALESYARSLKHHGSLEECVDSTQQQLILQREYMSMVTDLPWYWKRPAVTWSASGEADVVLSSQRQFIMPSHYAVNTLQSLWILASAFASLGRYAEARVAGMDAIACLEAVLQVDAWYADPARWWHTRPQWQRGDIATWVSVDRGPSSNGSPLSLLLTDAEGAETRESSHGRG
ncbi:hypothetical protein HGRIS_013697 [Hohenbuehelia grisea]|uniref:Fungal N-terminal domain-containing protein n=1 Tax=Hohenbuehelia grisea TaxID=104357 RepID=A0ABR3IWI6_9AGAR